MSIASAAPPTVATSFVALLRQRAQEDAGAPLYTFLLDGEQAEATLSATQLDLRARAIAAALQQTAPPGSRALLLFPPGLDYIAAFFGCLYAGVVAVPLYPPDLARPDRTLPRLYAVAADAQPTVVLATAAIQGLAAALGGADDPLGRLPWLATDALPDAEAGAWRPYDAADATAALIQYTSGSTASPKGVVLTHGQLLHNSAAIARRFGHDSGSQGVIWLPPYHDMGLIGGILQPLYAGFPVALMSPLDFLQRPLRWLGAITRYRATTSGGPNFAYDLCLRKIAPEQRAALDLSSWRVAFNGAEPVRAATLAHFAEAFGPCGFDARAFYPCYGLAEATLFVSGGAAGPSRVAYFDRAALAQHRVVACAPGEAGAQALVGCGQPLADQSLVVVDPATRTRCADGRVGELWLAGPSVAQGYWRRPEDTAHAFAARCADDGAQQFLRTGDLGFMRDGELFITGRLKDLIIVRGRNLYPQDLELTAARSHPALRPGGGAAFAVEQDGGEQLVVVYELDRRHQSADVAQVADAIRAAIAAEHAVPVHAIALVRPSSIPKTSSGKIQRYACRAAFLEGKLAILGTSALAQSDEANFEPELAAADSDAGALRERLRTAGPEQREPLVAAALRALVAPIVQQAPARLDPRQPLGALGLDSLGAVELQHAIETACGVAVPLAALLDGPSLEQLAGLVAGRLRDGEDAAPAPDIPRVVGAQHPLTPGQRSLWLLHQLAPEDQRAAYTIASAITLSGPLDIAALRTALQALIDRHSAWRTCFPAPQGEAVQLVREHVALDLPIVDARRWSAAELDARLAAAAHQPFDLATGPLVRLTLFRRADAEHVLLLLVHHIVADFWSLVVVLDEVRQRYAAQVAGKPAPRLPDAVSFGDYARWLEARLAGPAGQEQWEYWRHSLGGELPALRLPTDRPRPPVPTYRGADLHLLLDDRLRNALRALALAQGATLSTLLLAAFAALLARYGGQDELLIGVPAAARSHPALEGVVGALMNPVIVRSDGSGDPPFAAFLAQMRRTMQAALAHQEYPAHLLAERLRPARNGRHAELFQALFVFNRPQRRAVQDISALALGMPYGELALDGLTLRAYPLARRVARFELELDLTEVERGLAGLFQYNTDLFDASTIRRIARHYRTLLESIAAAPEQRLAGLPLLTPAERHQLLREWNDTDQPYPHERAHRQFEQQAARSPDAIAVMFDRRTTNDERRTARVQGSGVRDQDGTGPVPDPRPLTPDPCCLTYAELNARANRLARHLRALGVGPDVRVGVCLERSLEMIVALLAVLKAGGAYVPLDPTYPAERISFMLEDSGAAVLITANDELSDKETRRQGDKEIDGLLVSPSPALLVSRTSDDLPGDAALDQLAYVIYTSGSTGKPKGAMISQRALRNFIATTSRLFQVTPEDHMLQFASFCFDVSVFEIFTALLNGATLCLIDSDTRLSPPDLTALMRAQRVSIIDMPPAVMALLDGAAFPNLRVMFVGGEAFPGALVNDWALPGRLFVNGYGPTESTVTMTAMTCVPPYRQTPPIGRPLPNHRTYVLDRQLRPAPIGVPGELHIGGVGLARGYLGRPDLTAERFIPNPFARDQGSGIRDQGQEAERRTTNDQRRTTKDESNHLATLSACHLVTQTGERLYRTGDLVRLLPDGTIEFLGRIDHQVKMRGFRVELGEIEATLASHPAVQESVVMVREDVPGQRRLAAYIVQGSGVRDQGSEDSTPDALTPDPRSLIPDLRAFLAERLPDYMLPATITVLDALPLTSSGKLDRRMLPAPDLDLLAEEQVYLAPRTPTEATLARLWAEVLQLERVGVTDNFFALGGHSLLVTKVVARIRESYAIELPLQRFFAAPTVAALAAQIDEAATDAPAPALPPLQPAPRDRDLPLSFPQERIWFIQQLDPHNAAYHVPRAVRIDGALRLELLEATFSAIVRRHEILRTTFPARDGQPIQVIHAPARVRIPLLDLRALAPELREAQTERLIGALGRQPFDLARGPLLRLRALRLDDQAHVLILVEHHLVHDGWTQGVLLQEFLTLYAAFAAGRPSPLPELPLQYADFAYWQRTWLRGPALERQLAYWQRQLAGAPELLELPADFPRPPVQSFRGELQVLTLEAELVQALRMIGQRADATLFMVMMAAFDVLLLRTSGQTDLCVGTGIANRRRRELEGMLGMIINTVVLRTDASGNPPFGALLEQVRRVCLDAYAHQDVPFEKLVEVLAPARSLSYTALFQVLFAFLDTPTPELTLPDLRMQLLEAQNRSAKFDLEIIAVPHSPQRIGIASRLEQGALTIRFQYNTDIFAEATITRLLAHFRTLLEGIAADPGRRLLDLPLLPEDERRQLLIDFNATDRLPPLDRFAHELFEDRARERPEAIAAVCGQEHISYDALNRCANRAARWLRREGYGRNDRVGVCGDRGIAMLVLLLATCKAGCVYTPLDPAHPDGRLRTIIESGDVRLIATQSELAGRLAEVAGASAPRPRLFCWDAAPAGLPILGWRALGNLAESNLDVALAPHDLANIFFTSGSTGAPKGVMVEQVGMLNHLWAKIRRFELDECSVVAQNAAHAFDISIWQFLAALMAGGRVAIYRDEIALDPVALLRAVRDDRVAVLETVPTMLGAMLKDETLAAAGAGGGLPRDLRYLISNAETLPVALCRRWFEHFPRVPLVNTYGATECSDDTTHIVLREPPDANALRAPVGTPIAGFAIYVMDAQLQPVPIGCYGQIAMAGVGVGQGYLGDPARTAARFVPNPFAPPKDVRCPEGAQTNDQGDESSLVPGRSSFVRLYLTGDIGRWNAAGELEFVGRIDGQVKLRGFRVELGEIEATLRRHPAVLEAAVLAREDGAGDKQLVGYVVQGSGVRDQGSGGSTPDVLIPGPRPLIPDLRAFLQERLPHYAVPSALVLLEQMPVTPNGKIDRRALPVPEPAELGQSGAYAAPRTPVEEVLAGIWANLIGCAGVGIYDNFFELGGHSLLATQIVTRMRDTFQVEVPLRRLFEKPTVAELAELIEELRRTQAGPQLPPITPAPREGDPPLSFAQQRLWFLDQLQPDNPSYNVPAAIGLSGPLDIGALRRGLAAVVARHEALRTTFALVDGQPAQHIASTLAIALPLVDLQPLPDALADAAAHSLAMAEARRPFDLARGPLLRATLLRLRPDRHVLLLTMHHIVSDGWSMGVLVRELTTLYSAASRGQPAALPPLPIQYADYAAWQRQWLEGELEGEHRGSPLQPLQDQGEHRGSPLHGEQRQGEHRGSPLQPLQTQLAYWTAQLQGAPALLNLPTDFVRPSRRSFAGARQPFALAPDLAAQLLALSQRMGATLFMTLLSAFALLLARYTDQDDIVLGTPIANRTCAETEHLIGFFANTLALRVELAGVRSFEALVRRVRAVCLDAYAHQDLPFERLVEALAPARSLNYNPLFQAMFTFGAAPSLGADGSELTAAALDVHSGTTKFDLTLNLDSARPDLGGWLEYSTELFEVATITRMLAQFQTLLSGIAAAPERPLAELPLATLAEQQELLRLGQALRQPAPAACVHDLFAAQARRTPDAVALAAPDGQLSYRALDACANQLAGILRARGIGHEAIAGVFLERTLDLIVALLGILKAGGVYLPLDRTSPLDRRALMLQDARAALLISREALREECPSAAAPILFLDDLAGPQTGDSTAPPVSVAPEQLAYVIYTSGSTGQPKGVMVAHDGLGNMVEAQIRAFGVQQTSRVLQFASISFDASISEIFMALLAGATLCLEHRDALLPGPALIKHLDRHAITTVTLSPSVLAALPNAALPALRTLIAAGEDCSAEQAARWAMGRRFFNAYGPTEATVCAATAEYADARRHPAIGRPLPNVEAYVLDELLRPAPVGAPGELYIGGAGLARGYLGRPDLTAATFLPNPFTTSDAQRAPRRTTNGVSDHSSFVIRPSSRLYRTGDRARWLASGELEYLGRRDEQIKLRGYRVELGEIEAVARSHDAVRQCAVVMREDVPGERRLVAYVVPANDQRPTTNDERRRMKAESEPSSFILRPSSLVSELRSFLAQHLPGYMIPAAFVVLDALPLTPSGKLDRRALPSAGDLPTPEESYVAPRTPLEEILATLWAEVLGVARVGVHDNFFELGGHSLLVTQLVARVRAVFAVDLPVQELFTSTTVARLADAMRSYEPEPGQSERVARALKKVLSLSNTELAALLREKRGAQ